MIASTTERAVGQTSIRRWKIYAEQHKPPFLWIAFRLLTAVSPLKYQKGDS